MLAQRAIQQSLRRLAVQQPASLSRFAAPAAIATGNAVYYQRRFAATTHISEGEASNAILAKQRLNRPVSPHLSIYQPQITWYPSIMHRITGSILSGGFYIFGFLYLVGPVLGWHVESQVVATAFGAWPVAAKFMTKFFLGWTFSFKTLQGLKHLVWDTASFMTNKQVQISGWAAVGLSLVGGLTLALV